MPRWLGILLVGSLAVFVTCVMLAIVMWSRAGSAVSHEVASVIATQVADNSDRETGEIVLTEADLDINNIVSFNGSCGVNLMVGNAEIYGVITEITPSDISFVCADKKYSAVPVVVDGLVQLTAFEGPGGMIRLVLPRGKLKAGVEKGINDALAARGVTPTGIILHNGSITILTTEETI
jgi:hypothetical protein